MRDPLRRDDLARYIETRTSPLTAKEIARKTGCSIDLVRQVASQLWKEGRIRVCILDRSMHYCKLTAKQRSVLDQGRTASPHRPRSI